ncbi:MarR family transcriptional regulator [Psychromonas sp. B3M02]|uniref:MarR family winged helix-turn-helix transcriptional regulator n=1 Tax=Psychromonas sp. B3M02 TaxID=2267226 RepID=UPI000DEA5969|nr:MarR family transcriptional regulator [Psychromonas sp. B3M02]RBW46062.1 MarR family transcriptional regulator [Psychromonas sp. B3M02]
MDTPIINNLFTLMQRYRMTMRDVINANELGLNAMHVRCLHIIEATEACTANDIVQKMQRDKAQVARLVKDLMNLGFIEKNASKEDKRRFILSFTESGSALLMKLLAAQKEINNSLCKGLNKAQLDTFLSVVDKMSENLK